ncbi:MAG: hypothetical protein E3J87_02535 [Candidatus Cloacimonadota bacterium]|nr:MAG: hypothetical protein E3J87_02535 [Candidatus Cloacimonadota bacterium]
MNFETESVLVLLGELKTIILAVDKDLKVQFTDDALCKKLGIDDCNLTGEDIRNILPPYIIQKYNIIPAIKTVFESDNDLEIHNLIYSDTPYNKVTVFDIEMKRIVKEIPLVLLLINDVTRRAKKEQELLLLFELSYLMQESNDLDKLSYLILTAVTAGHAFGFNRAFLLLVDTEKKFLKGRMALGPTSSEEAREIWAQVSRKSLKELLLTFNKLNSKEELPLFPVVEKFVYRMKSLPDIIKKSLEQKEVVRASRFDEKIKEKKIFDILEVDEFIVIPLMSDERTFGVIFADNIFNRAPISEDDFEKINIFADFSSLAIKGVMEYRRLENRKRELEEYQKLINRLKNTLRFSEKLSTLSETVAYIAHEIRTPLSNIGGFASGILRKPDDLERVRKNAGIIADETKRLERLLDRAITFVKGPEIHLSLENINDTIIDIVESMANDLHEKDIIITKSLDSNLPLIPIDRDRIKQGLLNILRNAIHTMEKGGEIRIKTTEEKDFIKMEIEDNGKGIPKEILHNIFNPFFSTKRRGLGLGLTITQKIMNAHGGFIKVESEVGKGTVFSVFLLKKKENNKSETGTRAQEHKAQG